MIALFVVICMRDLVNWILRLKRKRDEKRRIIAEQKAAEEAHLEEIRRMQEEERIEDLKAGESVELETESIQNTIEDPVSFEQNPSIYSIDDEIENTTIIGEDDIEEDSAQESPLKEDSIKEDSQKEETSQDETLSEVTIVEPDIPEDTADDVDTMKVNVNQIAEVSDNHYKIGEGPADNFPYNFPPFDILRQGKERISVDNEEQLENKEKIRNTLLDFGIPITRIEATVGPTVTLYEIVPDKGVKIAKIRSLVDDIALSLSAKGVRIIAPIPGKGTVGIEVANKDPQVVSMRTIIKSKKFQESKYTLPVAIGSTISNDVYIADLAKMPHLLVAGATGQGKSVGLNAIIA
ncbi:MAG: DNA translocase FtsK, partial [Muribaculaceae bacterium]|nr:DNA translocase FtsK [Muribaculaceae bacterium]